MAPQKAARVAANGASVAKLDGQKLYAHGKLMDTLCNLRATVTGTIRGRRRQIKTTSPGRSGHR